MEFEWKIFPGFTAVGILNEMPQMMGKVQCEPENFTGRIIFMSMFNDIVWDAEGHDELCVNNSKKIKEYAERFPRGHWCFLGPKSEKSGTELTMANQMDLGIERRRICFRISKVPVIRYSSVPAPWREDT